MEMPNKYPEYSYERSSDDLYTPLITFCDGCGARHADYLYEMSYRRPIMALLFYRWWIPTLLTPFDREIFNRRCRDSCQGDGRPYWVMFSLYHPVQFMLLLFVRRVFVFFKKLAVKLLAAPVKAMRWLFKL